MRTLSSTNTSDNIFLLIMWSEQNWSFWFLCYLISSDSDSPTGLMVVKDFSFHCIIMDHILMNLDKKWSKRMIIINQSRVTCTPLQPPCEINNTVELNKSLNTFIEYDLGLFCCSSCSFLEFLHLVLDDLVPLRRQQHEAEGQMGRCINQLKYLLWLGKGDTAPIYPNTWHVQIYIPSHSLNETRLPPLTNNGNSWPLISAAAHISVWSIPLRFTKNK